MPFGLPGLSAAEHRVLTRWLEQGAPYEGPAAPTPLATQRVAQWERFFNGDSLKERLFSRYAYEHLFLAHLYFDDDPERQYFRLVRSATPPGQPLRLIATRRPVDDPGVERVYYRLVPERETIVAKTHMPYALGAAADGALARAVPRRARTRWSACPATARTRPPIRSPTFAALPVARALPLHARRGRVHDHGLHQGAGVSRPDGAQRHRRPLLGRLPRALAAAPTRRSRRCWRATSTCCACRPAAATPRS